MKKRITRLTGFLLFICLSTFQLKAQQDTLGMSLSYGINNFPDTVFSGSNHNIDVYVVNKGNTTVNTLPYYVVLGVDSGVGIVPYDSVPVNTALNPGDSVQVPISEIINIGPYRLGGNVVVIWPIANNVITRDSVRKNVYVVNNSAVIESDAAKADVRIFPNPSSSDIYIKSASGLKSITVYELSGRIIDRRYFSMRNTNINIRNLPSGLYFICVKLVDDRIIYRKICIEK